MRNLTLILVAIPLISGCICNRPRTSPEWEYRFIYPDELEKIMTVPVLERPESGAEEVKMRVDRLVKWLNDQGKQSWELVNINDVGIWLKRKKN